MPIILFAFFLLGCALIATSLALPSSRLEKDAVRKSSPARPAAVSTASIEPEKHVESDPLRVCSFTALPAREAFSPLPLGKGEEFRVTIQGAVECRRCSFAVDARYAVDRSGNFRQALDRESLLLDAKPAYLRFVDEERDCHRYTFSYEGTGKKLSVLLREDALAHDRWCVAHGFRGSFTITVRLPSAEEREVCAQQEKAKREEKERKEREAAEKELAKEREVAEKELAKKQREEQKTWEYLLLLLRQPEVTKEEKQELLDLRRCYPERYAEAYEATRPEREEATRARAARHAAEEAAREDARRKAEEKRRQREAEIARRERDRRAQEQARRAHDHERWKSRERRRLQRVYEARPYLVKDDYLEAYARTHRGELLHDKERIETSYLQMPEDLRRSLKEHSPELLLVRTWEMRALALAEKQAVIETPARPIRKKLTVEEVRAIKVRREQVQAEDKIALKRAKIDAIVKLRKELDSYELEPDERQRLETELIEDILDEGGERGGDSTRL